MLHPVIFHFGSSYIYSFYVVKEDLAHGELNERRGSFSGLTATRRRAVRRPAPRTSRFASEWVNMYSRPEQGLFLPPPALSERPLPLPLHKLPPKLPSASVEAQYLLGDCAFVLFHLTTHEG